MASPTVNAIAESVMFHYNKGIGRVYVPKEEWNRLMLEVPKTVYASPNRDITICGAQVCLQVDETVGA